MLYSTISRSSFARDHRCPSRRVPILNRTVQGHHFQDYSKIIPFHCVSWLISLINCFSFSLFIYLLVILTILVIAIIPITIQVNVVHRFHLLIHGIQGFSDLNLLLPHSSPLRFSGIRVLVFSSLVESSSINASYEFSSN